MDDKLITIQDIVDYKKPKWGFFDYFHGRPPMNRWERDRGELVRLWTLMVIFASMTALTAFVDSAIILTLGVVATVGLAAVYIVGIGRRHGLDDDIADHIKNMTESEIALLLSQITKDHPFASLVTKRKLVLEKEKIIHQFKSD